MPCFGNHPQPPLIGEVNLAPWQLNPAWSPLDVTPVRVMFSGGFAPAPLFSVAPAVHVVRPLFLLRWFDVFLFGDLEVVPTDGVLRFDYRMRSGPLSFGRPCSESL